MDVVRILLADHRDHLPALLAYIDPGTGSLAFQALAAMLLSGAVFFKALRTAMIRAVTLPYRWLRSRPRETAADQRQPSPASSEPSQPRRKAA